MKARAAKESHAVLVQWSDKCELQLARAVNLAARVLVGSGQ